MNWRNYKFRKMAIEIENMPINLSAEMFEKMVNGESVNIGNLSVSLPNDFELKFIDIIEQKLVKEYGLDVEEKAEE